MKIKLDIEALKFIKSSINKMALDNDTSDRALKHFGDLNAKLSSDLTYGSDMLVEINITRAEAVTIREIATPAIERITNILIPAYEKRKSEQPEQAEFYQEYIDSNTVAVEALTELLSNIQGALK